MRSVTCIAVGLLLVGVAWFDRPQAQAPAARAVLFEGARVITGDGTTVIERSAFVVENGKFSAVGRQGDIRAPNDATRVDLTGKTVIPGIVDAHTHIGYQNMRDITPVVKNYTRENILDHLQRAAYFGVVAVNSMGYEFGDLPEQMRVESMTGKLPAAARFLHTGRGITTPDALREDNGRQSAYGPATEAEARKAVQELAASKNNLVKLWVVGPGGGRFGSKEAMKPELYRAVIDEAHKNKMRVVVHPDEEFVKDLIRSGVDGIAHTTNVIRTWDEELLSLMKQRGSSLFFMTTMGGADPSWQDDPPPYIKDVHAPMLWKQLQDARARNKQRETPEATEKARLQQESVKNDVRNILATGVKIVGASDAGGLVINTNLIGLAALVELEDMVASGLTPQQAIAAFTRNAADVLLLDDLGTIAKDKSADFVVLDANPLDDIKSTRQIGRVFIRGREIDRAGLRSQWSKWWSVTPSAQ